MAGVQIMYLYFTWDNIPPATAALLLLVTPILFPANITNLMDTQPAEVA